MTTFNIPHQSPDSLKNPAMLLENFKALEDRLNDGAILLGATTSSVTFSATPGTEASVTHTLGRKPLKWIIVRVDKQAEIFESDFSNWTATVAKFKVAAVGVSSGVQEQVTATILLF